MTKEQVSGGNPEEVESENPVRMDDEPSEDLVIAKKSIDVESWIKSNGF